jgi:hypothetical protein
MKMGNLIKSNILTSIELIIRTLGKKKKNVEKIILKIWVQNVPSSIKVGSFYCSVIQGLNAWSTLPHTLSKTCTLSMDTKHAFLRWDV